MQQVNDINKLLEEVRKSSRIAKQLSRGYADRTSKLEPYRGLIMSLHGNGASYREIESILKRFNDPPVKVSHTTISRFIAKTIQNRQSLDHGEI